MSTLRTPVGPQPNKVYWRRRLLVLLGVLVVVLIVILIVVRPGGSPKPTTTHTPTAPHTVAAITDCKPSVVEVVPVMDAVSYAPGVDPKLSLKITNTGAVACNFKAGSDVQDYEITTGSQKVWSSKDCQKNPVPTPVKLEPDVAVSSTPFTWDRTASSSTTCSDKNKKQVVAGGASYHLAVTVDGVASTKSLQFVLK